LLQHLKASLLPHMGAEAFEAARRSLNWAAQLHEIGAHISHTDSHKHGAYIIDNSDALGFTLNELHGLSLLVLGHKGKLQKIIADYDDVAWTAPLLCLRLAVLFCHARAEPDLQDFSLIYLGARQCELGLPAKWAEQFPQSAHLLQNEVKAWQKIGWQLNLVQIN
jgi:exopolyphosphatase / guanosine-5'-triphosphate,3'-diphosphate pyrophosphatase